MSLCEREPFWSARSRGLKAVGARATRAAVAIPSYAQGSVVETRLERYSWLRLAEFAPGTLRSLDVESQTRAEERGCGARGLVAR